MTELLVSPSVSLVNGRPAVTSFDIAEHFSKRHCDVLRDIRKIMEAIPDDLRERNFALTFRTVAGPNNSQRQEEYFIIYQDGFMLLVMGYTGTKAMRIKIAYIVRFNEMAEELRRQREDQASLPSPTPETPITPDQQCTLQNMVKALVDKGGHYAALWSRFNNHFRLGSYKQLPQSLMGEAVSYLMRMEVAPKPEQKALPESETEASELERLFAGIRLRINEIADLEREIFRIVKNGMGRALLDIGSPRRAIAIQAHIGMEQLFYSLDYGMQAARATIQAALIAGKM